MTEDKNIQPTDEDEDVEGHRLNASTSRVTAANARVTASTSRIGERLQNSDEGEDDDVEGHSFTRERLTNVTDRIATKE
jgi:hypothetical protein